MGAADAREADFKQWIIDLRFEGEQFYSNFEVIPEHWRDNFEDGLTPRQAFERIMDGVVEFKRRKGLS